MVYNGKNNEIYKYIQEQKQFNSSTTYIILLSRTPVATNLYEYALIFNLLRPKLFPVSEEIFNQLCTHNINMVQRRILGLVSYYKPINDPKITIHMIDVIPSMFFNTYFNKKLNIY